MTLIHIDRNAVPTGIRNGEYGIWCIVIMIQPLGISIYDETRMNMTMVCLLKIVGYHNTTTLPLVGDGPSIFITINAQYDMDD